MSEDKNLKQAIQEHDKRINNVTALKGDDWQDQLRLTTQGAIRRSSLYNILLFIENDPNLKGVLAYNEFSDRVVKLRSNDKTGLKKGDWRDTDDSLLRFYCDAQYNILLSKDNLLDSIVKASQEHGFDPMKERIEAVQWDGQPRAETFFIDYLGAEDNHYTRMVTRKWLAGAIARVYLPGVKFDIIPILEGAQGLGKSTLVRQLAPDYFSDDMKSMKDKDDYQKLMGSWIIELAELSAMNKTDIESIKNFTSAQSDYYRNTYARRPEQHPRRNVFIGSTNHRDYLKDATGERRFYPIKCGVQPVTKNPLKAKQADMLQILAEAKTWFDAGEKLYFDQQTLNEAKTYQQEAQVIDPMREAVNDYLTMMVPTNWEELTISVKQSYFTAIENGNPIDSDSESWLHAKLAPNKEPIQRTTTREIMAVVFDHATNKYFSGRTNTEAKKIKLIMDNMEGWEYRRTRMSNKQTRGYVRLN
ncbi:virulence protein [Lactiplantibacillus pentosus]|uniref:Virulence-associated E family protein n=1 Tax=Lactiplantibacillus pentosus TaxID=1589 RepID=A0AAW8WHG7_LACPE|nr:virulence-associated E family protein [Lactiplantibacillus pentosus]MBU7483832.1 virulence protein [Lactiplantibacillus sp. 30.2.29]MBU7461251.1 virulence protein [Lactiplantibacillus pentosus]MBU7487150.1 virulence protein [Lactiplantibacillus pentosus]MBU7500153.1 virulence protein [Lactiplantibacillus pentosus]MBU7506753.1 virulence protein [Lactiplantibacillus pentosus]